MKINFGPFSLFLVSLMALVLRAADSDHVDFFCYNTQI